MEEKEGRRVETDEVSFDEKGGWRRRNHGESVGRTMMTKGR